MSIVFAFWHCFKSLKPSKVLSFIVLIAFWCTFEYIHLNWEITWPWLNIGNVFAISTQYVQWYEYTGTFGGTIWVFIVNILLYELIKLFTKYQTNKKEQGKSDAILKRDLLITTISFLSVLIIPMIISITIYTNYTIKKKNGIEAVIVQQNTDPWEEQYTMSNVKHTERIIKTALPHLTAQTALLICSESAIPHNISATELADLSYPVQTYEYYGFILLDSLILQHPQLNLIVGLSTSILYDYKKTPTTRNPRAGLFYDAFNTSICYNTHKVSGMYHKSKLVPGVEKMPYPTLFKFLEYLVIDLGGTSGSLGVDSMQRAFKTTVNDGTLKIGAPICYESIYGELFGNFVKDGAQIMSVITNDAWWKESPGHKQHFLLSKLRAIETRRYILRAANTGISAFIDPLGNSSQNTKYGTRTAIKEIVYPNEDLTFYVKHGDYLARFSVAITILSLLLGTAFWIRRKIKK
jgi:apolipoprotein N-acyltransferase